MPSFSSIHHCSYQPLWVGKWRHVANKNHVTIPLAIRLGLQYSDRGLQYCEWCWELVTHGTCPSLCIVLRTCDTLPSNMPAWYPLQLDPWQLSLKYSNSATELMGDLVTRLGHGRPFTRLWVRVTPWVSHFFLGTRPTWHPSDYVYL